ncbi:aryl-alcohol dehydrogenase-like predicted oxidoreductase [Curtobacterium sp. PhB130]|uniref:aldo/keto reductase n=1 Tax=unclassified Curtobacterium TaxID=257496 RepID=UPI000F4CFEDF|nr:MULTISPECIES: aldo/keto reductase [unclassified Curtobacterium]ROS74913.1 aryl-alcohol dehydrogenase-like predicted oxidoreductase [Curtobacterium sp. PhB130]TCK63527.1 aryl-alcohol dehydrogenase-like predicted oxidoreductase [Curtobacterium sp. PhB136]
MQQRTLGQQGLVVGSIGYGAMGTTYAYGPGDDTESIAAIRRAHELGVTHFDTAELYGWGTGEQLLGTALAPIRDEVTIATKFGFTPETYAPNSQLDHIREVVDTSLRNLGTDSIDLLYQHIHDPAVPIEDVVGVMQEYVQAGKVRFLGLSNTDAESIRRANAVHPISVLQTEYSIFSRESEDLFPVVDELGVGLVAYSPLARGFLSGAVGPRSAYAPDDIRQFLDWWAPEHYDANAGVVAGLTELAAAKGISLSQLALAWILAQRDDIVPIPGSRNPGRVAENVAAADVTFTPEELARIDALGHGVRGKRAG